MSDFIWFIMIAVIFLLSGLIFMVFGWQIWKNQKMSLIISYHCDKVQEENKQVYCTLSGIGVFIIGVGFTLSGICTVFFQTVHAFTPMTFGLVLGIALLISAAIKYNK